MVKGAFFYAGQAIVVKLERFQLQQPGEKVLFDKLQPVMAQIELFERGQALECVVLNALDGVERQAEDCSIGKRKTRS